MGVMLDRWPRKERPAGRDRYDKHFEMGKNMSGGGRRVPESSEALFTLLVDPLRRYARRMMNRERANHTLQPTALVNEAYLKLHNPEPLRFTDANHLFRSTANIMRQILVEHARRTHAKKRTRPEGGTGAPVWWDPAIDMADLDDALRELGRLDPVAEKVVELRYILGANVQETSEALKISESTVGRKWTAGRAYLRRALQ